MNIRGLSKFFFSYEHVFANYFLGTKRVSGGYLRGRSMLNSLAVIYASYYPELDLSIYRSTQTSLRLLFGLNSLDDILRSEAFGIKAFLVKTSDSWYLKYGHHNLLPLRVAARDATFMFSRNGLFHRLLFDEYRVQFRKTWSQKQYLDLPDAMLTESSLDSQYAIFRERNPFFFLNTKRFTEFSIFEARSGDRFYKTHELSFGNHLNVMQRGALFETYLLGRQQYEKLRVANLNLDVRFKQGFNNHMLIEATRRGFYYFCCTFSKLALGNYLGLCAPNVDWLRHLFSRLLAPSILLGKALTHYFWLHIIAKVFSFGRGVGALYRWHELYKFANLRQNFCRVNAQSCAVPAVKLFLRSAFCVGLLNFTNILGLSFGKSELNTVLNIHFFRGYCLKLGWGALKFKSIFGARNYTLFSKIWARSSSLNEIAAMAQRCFLAKTSMYLNLTFLKTCCFEFLLSIVNQATSLLMLAELRLNNLYAFRIITQLAVGYPGLYLPDTKYEQVFKDSRRFLRRSPLRQTSVMDLQGKLMFKKLRITSILPVILRETLVFTELIPQNFIKWWQGLQSLINAIPNNVHILVGEFFSWIRLISLAVAINSNASFAGAVRRNSSFNLFFETTLDLRVLLNMNWAFSNGTLPQCGFEKSLYSARFLHFNLKHYHKILATKIDKLYHNANFASVFSGVFTSERDATVFQTNCFFKQFDQMTAISATPNLSATLQLNYGRSGILNIFRNVGVADYSQFFNLYAQSEIANFSLTRHSLLLDAGAVRIRGSANYMFFDALSKAFFVTELRDQQANSAVNLAITPFEAPLFFSEHLKLGGFLNVFDYGLPSGAVRESIMNNISSTNVRYFSFSGGYGSYTNDRRVVLSCRTRKSGYPHAVFFERNSIMHILCDELLKV